MIHSASAEAADSAIDCPSPAQPPPFSAPRTTVCTADVAQHELGHASEEPGAWMATSVTDLKWEGGGAQDNGEWS